MKLPGPTSSRQYPIYIIGYILVFFLITFLISALSILPRISKDGLYVNYYPCLSEGTDDYGRPACDQFGSIPNAQIPVGSWLINQTWIDLALVSVIGIPLGLYGWSKFGKRSEVNPDDY